MSIIKICINCDNDYLVTTKTLNLHYFCTTQCAIDFAGDCGDHRIRRVGGTLVRYEKGDERLRVDKKQLENWLTENDKKVEKLLVEEWGFDRTWVRKANEQCRKNRKRK